MCRWVVLPVFQIQVMWLVFAWGVTLDLFHQLTFISKAGYHPKISSGFFSWHRYVSLWFDISFQSPLPLQPFHTWNFLLSSSTHPVLSFHRGSSASPLLPQTSSGPTWAFHIAPIILHSTFTPLVFFITTVLFISKSLSSPLLSPVLSSSRGKRGFLSESPEHSFLFCLLFDFFFPSSLSLSLSVSFYLSLSLSQFDRDLNRLCGDYTISLN